MVRATSVSTQSNAKKRKDVGLDPSMRNRSSGHHADEPLIEFGLAVGAEIDVEELTGVEKSVSGIDDHLE